VEVPLQLRGKEETQLASMRKVNLPPHLAAVLSLVAVFSVDCSAQGTQQDAVTSDTSIHVTTRLVQVGVIVTNKQGAVTNLTRDDFAVFDRGHPQKSSLFSVEAPEKPSDKGSQPPLSLPADTFSNVPQYGSAAPASVTIVLLDNLNTLHGSAPMNYEGSPYGVEDLALQNAKAHLIEYIKQLRPQDRVALYGLTTNLRPLRFHQWSRAASGDSEESDTSSRTNRTDVEPTPVQSGIIGFLCLKVRLTMTCHPTPGSRKFILISQTCHLPLRYCKGTNIAECRVSSAICAVSNRERYSSFMVHEEQLPLLSLS
jgi:hypothetical protein